MAKGDIVAIQDADLEYDPQDLLRLVHPIIEGRADAVFGSRFCQPVLIVSCISGTTWVTGF